MNEALCMVCKEDPSPYQEGICQKCIHPERVRVFCASCRHRLDLSVSEATELFKLAGHDLGMKGGIALRFNAGCPLCCQGQIESGSISQFVLTYGLAAEA